MIKVNDLLYRGPRPTNMLDLAALNFGAIINLEDGVYDLLHNDVYEQQQPIEYNIRPYRFHLSDWRIPNLDNVWHIVRAIQGENRAGRSVYVHCLHGVDRTGYVIAAYRIASGWPVHVAIKEMYEQGFHRFPYFYWVSSLSKFSR